jgi:hypothetical protein
VNRVSRAVVAALRDTVHGVPVWDAAPVLYRLYLHGEAEAEVRPVAVSPELWSTPHTGMRTPEVLDMIAGQMAAFGLVDGQVFGMAFCHEGWTVPDEVIDDYHAGRQALEMSGDHRLYQHPQRVEVRIMTAVDRRGMSYMVEHTRGGGTRHVVASPGRDPQLAGAVLEALDRMVEQLTGFPAQARRSSMVPSREAN